MSPGKKNLDKSQISLARWRNENLSSADQKKVIACALQLLCNSPSVGCFCTPVTLSETFLSFFFFCASVSMATQASVSVSIMIYSVLPSFEYISVSVT